MSGISPEDLFWTKLKFPTARSDVVERPRLMVRLAEGLARPLTLICAPAGYGKTTLLGQWLAQQAQTIAWLSLDKQDNDPGRFWIGVIAALQTLQPDIGQKALDELQAIQPPPLVSVLPALLAEIARRSASLILVLDDYQFIAERAIHESLTFCLEHLPPQMHLVMATRADPPLPLARFRVRNLLTELRVTDLRFTTDEAEIFLNRMTSLALSPEDMAGLQTRTEGWAAGLQLAALSLQGHRDVAGFVKAFTGSHVFVAEYLVEEVLQHQPEDVQMFLLQTAILDRLNAGLCEAITGRQDAHAVLVALQRANLFVIPLDNQAEWFRYHHLFLDLLRARLRQALPADVLAALHVRAADWYTQHGYSVDAIEHALAGKDYERAASLVEGRARAMMFSGSVNILKNWLETLPEAAFQAHPRLAIYRIWINVIQGKADLSEQAAQATDAMLKALPPSPDNEQLRLEWMVISCRFIALTGNAARAIHFSLEALVHLAEGDLASRARVHSALTIAYGMEGDLEKAHHAYRECLNFALAAGYYSLAAHTSMIMASGMYQHYGQLREAERTYQSIVDMGNLAGYSVFFPAGQGYIGLAEISLERYEFDAVEGYLQQGISLCGQAGLAGLSTGYVIESHLRQIRGDFEGALESLRTAEQVAPRGDFTAMIRQIPLRLAIGDVENAARWAAPFMQFLGTETAPVRVPLLLVEIAQSILSRVLLAQGEIERAMQFLDQLQATAEAGKRFGRLIDVHLLRALALQKQNGGNVSPEAQDSLERALTLAEPEGYVALFLDEAPAVLPLLNAVATHPDSPARLKAYARKLLNASHATGKPVASGALGSADLVEPLTARELEVLALIATGDSNRTIADKLVITVSAVKKHTSNIFGKLNVSSRTQAIARARQLGLFRTDG